MSRNNQAHRAAKRKERLRRASANARRVTGGDRVDASSGMHDRFDPPLFGRPEAIDVLSRLVPALSAAATQADQLDLVTTVLLDRHGDHLDLFDEIATLRLMAVLGALWEGGWQPADVMHIARRSDERLVELAGAVVSEHGRRTQNGPHIPASWRHQLEVVREAGSRLHTAVGQGWYVVDVQLRHRDPPLLAWCLALRLLGAWQDLPRITPLMDPPSRWRTGGAPRAGRQRGQHVEDRMLSKIRALLAKAEATTHPAEAETYTAKAQDLMTRHAIDASLLHADEPSVATVAIRIHLLNPYTDEKAMFLASVAAANRCRTVMDRQFGFSTLIGTPVDVDNVCMLFTSLLVQATAAVAGAGSDGARARSRSFRRGFWAAYAARIGQRLREADASATATFGAELVPVFRRQSEAIDAETQRLFPRMVAMGANYDSRGWQAGTAAADRAVLVSGALDHAAH